MLKQGLIYLTLSVLVVLLAHYAHLALVYIDLIYAHINVQLIPIFNFIGLGFFARKIVLLLLLPIVLVGIPALIYKLIKGKPMPYLLEITWMVWLTLVLCNVLIRY